MKVRLKQDCSFDKTTMNVGGRVITIRHDWTEVPTQDFINSDMEIEGQNQESQVQVPIEKTIVVEQPKESIKEPIKPALKLRTTKK